VVTVKVLLERIRLSPALGAALLAIALFGALAYADFSGSSSVAYKAFESTVAPAPNVDTASVSFASAYCDPGQQVMAGGVQVDDPSFAHVIDAYPDFGNTAWSARVASDDVTRVHYFTVTAICSAAPAAGPTGATGPSGPSGPSGPTGPTATRRTR
jgi:hypothetical protein